MNFFKQQSDYRENKVPSSPAATAKEIMYGHRSLKGYELHFLSLMFVLHPGIKPSELTKEERISYTNAIRQTTELTYGGLYHASWMNNIIGTNVCQTYVAAGQELLWEGHDNDSLDDDRKEYLLCVTRDIHIANLLKIPPEKYRVPVPGNFFGSFMVSRDALAGLTDNRQVVAYLLTIGYTVPQIAKVLEMTVGTVNNFQYEILERLKKFYKPNLDLRAREAIQAIISKNLQEVRSTVIPLYPGF